MITSYRIISVVFHSWIRDQTRSIVYIHISYSWSLFSHLFIIFSAFLIFLRPSMMANGPTREARYFPRAKLKPRFSLAASKCKIQQIEQPLQATTPDEHSSQGKDAAGTGSSLHTSITQFIWHSSPHGCNCLPKWSNSKKTDALNIVELWPHKVKATLWPPKRIQATRSSSTFIYKLLAD